MIKLSGKPVYQGIAMGPAAVLRKEDQPVKRIRIADTETEIARLKKAGKEASQQLQKLYEKAKKEVGESSAAIFEVHQMMLEDDDYLDAIHSMICTEMVNAEFAVAMTGDNFAAMFAGMDDDYMKARAADVKDISNRLIRNLSGEKEIDFASMEPSVIVADDLTPSETVQMDKEKILAFVTVHGSANSHTSILARMMNIPALIGVPVNLNEIRSGMTVMVDGFRGEAVFEPSEEIGMAARERIQKEQEIFCTQLRALLRAAVYGNLSVMYPMITSVDEVTKIYEIVERVKEELDTNGIPYKVPEQGIMIETPAAVMISDELAEMVDFFSIGTNDLTQYTLAVDRQNERLDDFYNPHHRAILKMIQMVVDNAHIAGKWAGICGELGADPKLTKRFIDMGIDELSVAPSMILPLREIVREI